MASCISFSSPLSLRSLLPSFLPLSTNKPSQFAVAQKAKFPLVSHSSSSLPFPLQTERARLGRTPFAVSYNVQVLVEADEPEEKLLGRFRREVFRAGIIQECKRRKFFENKHDKKKRKNREAAKRNRRRRFPFKPKPETEAVKKTQGYDIDDDNWDLPEDS
ncbi:hypothetical protein V2J09_015033 [Rumex salicifolius]